jgi:peptide/nickel transport system substrate-binding protein
MCRLLASSVLVVVMIEAVLTGLAYKPDAQARGLASTDLRPGPPPAHVLRIGVGQLPVNLTPGGACTDNERRLIDLLFQGLMRQVPGPDGSSIFRPDLTLAPPDVVPPLGRTFHCPMNAFWSDGTPVSARDIHDSYRALRDGKLGCSPAYAEHLEEPRFMDDKDWPLKLTQGVLEPNAFLTFKIVPRAQADEPPRKAFAGTGRFRVKQFKPGQELILEANPFYIRAGKENLPPLDEIHFIARADYLHALQVHEVDMVLDLTPAEVGKLADNAAGITLYPTMANRLPNRRIYFLALNHGKAPLGQVEFRRALAHALPIEQLMDRHYRAKAGKTLDLPPPMALTWREGNVLRTSPFPRGSWPIEPDPKKATLPSPGDLERLKKDVVPRDNDNITLRLLYPAGDPVLDEVMKDLTEGFAAQELLKGAFVKLLPEPLAPDQLRKSVEKTDYQIAYYYYDFPDDTFWLLPLLGPKRAQGAGNIFAYQNSDLETLLQEIDNSRDFTTVQAKMRSAHNKFATDVPFIPLWQVDPIVAIGPGVTPREGFDTQYLFADADRWGKTH